MLNQNSTSTEANNSGVFLKNYIDYVEEMPNDIQKCISRCREVDYKTKSELFNVNYQFYRPS